VHGLKRSDRSNRGHVFFEDLQLEDVSRHSSRALVAPNTIATARLDLISRSAHVYQPSLPAL